MASQVAKVKINMIAMEIVRAGAASLYVDGTGMMTRQGVLDAIEEVLRKDRLALTDAEFRKRYVAYIRNYWGKDLSVRLQ